MSLSASGRHGVQLASPGDQGGPLALEQGASSSNLGSTEQMDSLELSFVSTQETHLDNILSQSSDFEDSIDYAFLNETYSIPFSESKLKNENLTQLYSELCTEVQKREEAFFDILDPQDTGAVDLERTHEIVDAIYKESADPVQKLDVGEDSRQEYHSADQECFGSYLAFDRVQALSESQLDVSELMCEACGVTCVCRLEDSCVTPDSSSATSLDSQDFVHKCSSHVLKFQNSDTLKEHHKLNHENPTEQELSLTYHSAFGSIVERSSPLPSPPEALRAKIYTEKVNYQTTESKDVCGNRIVDNRVFQYLADPGMSPQDEALEALLQASGEPHPSRTSVFYDPFCCECDSTQYKSLQSTLDPASGSHVLPRMTVVLSQGTGEGGPPQSPSSLVAGDTCSPDDRDSRSATASHTVTTNRAAGSASSNSETVRSQEWPNEWQSGRLRSVACNTDWSDSQDHADTQQAVPTGQGRARSVDSLKLNGNSTHENSLELRKTFNTTDLKKHSERAAQLCKEARDMPLSRCCVKVMQRAEAAERHLLDAYYQTCRHHCGHLYKLLMARGGRSKRNLPSSFATKKLGPALLSVWGDLKVRYLKLKEKIHKGIPLEELPPLSVEAKLLSAFSTFASGLMQEESHEFSGEDSELDNQRVPTSGTSSGLKRTVSQVSQLSDDSHSKADRASKKDGLTRDDGDTDSTQLKPDDKVCRGCQETSEDWFDAKEKLSGADISDVQDGQPERNRWTPTSSPEMKTVEPLQRDKVFFIHVGGLCPSVSEVDLRSHFQKYQVSDIEIYDSPTNYRYASLALTTSSIAQMAVKEMNGMKINGKSINVRLLRTPGEHTSPLSSREGSGVGLTRLEKSLVEGARAAAPVSRVAKTRPRLLGPEQEGQGPLAGQQSVKKNCKMIESAQLLPETPMQFIPPDTLNLRSFTKIMKRLAELHPEVSREHIIGALQEVRVKHKGFLNGLSISAIVDMTSSFLGKSVSR